MAAARFTYGRRMETQWECVRYSDFKTSPRKKSRPVEYKNSRSLISMVSSNPQLATERYGTANIAARAVQRSNSGGKIPEYDLVVRLASSRRSHLLCRSVKYNVPIWCMHS